MVKAFPTVYTLRTSGDYINYQTDALNSVLKRVLRNENRLFLPSLKQIYRLTFMSKLN